VGVTEKRYMDCNPCLDRLRSLSAHSIFIKMLTDKDIEHIAKLARIKILPEEIPEIGEKLSSIFSYIEKLNNINTDGIQPVFQATDIVSALRDDKKEEINLDNNLSISLLKQAPEIKNDFVKVGSVLGRSKK